MSEFDVRFAAYESMMKRNNNFWMKGNALAQYYGDYSVRLQEALTRKEEKQFNKELGKEKAKQIAAEKAATRAQFDAVYKNSIAPALEQQFGQPKNSLLKGLLGSEPKGKLIPEVKPASTYDQLYRLFIEDEMGEKFGQSKNPLLKGITHGQSSQTRLIPEVAPKNINQVLAEDIQQQFKPKNPLLESIKPNQDFRGKNLIGEQYTEAQKILKDTIKPETKWAKFAKYGKWGAAIAAGALIIGGAWALLSGGDDKKQPVKADTPANSKNPLDKKISDIVKDSIKKEEIKVNPLPVKTDSTKTEEVKDSTKVAIAPADSTQTEAKDSTKVAIAPTDTTQTEAKDSTKAAPAPENSAKGEETEKVEETANNNEAKAKQTKPAYTPIVEVKEDGTYTTKRGDSFYKLAKQLLIDRNRERGIKENPSLREIQIEAERIMKANKYWYDEKHWFPNPMLHPNVNLKIYEVVD